MSRLCRHAFVLTVTLLTACQTRATTSPGPAVIPDEPPERLPADVEARSTPDISSAVALALVRLAPGEIPDLQGALQGDAESLKLALDRSLDWFGKPSSRDLFPLGDITHSLARASVYAFRELIAESDDGAELERRIADEFEFFAASGADGRGAVLFTGYYSPTFEGSRVRTEKYRYPLYRLPADLVRDTVSGEVLGQRSGDRIRPYPTRGEIEESGMLAGTELAWLSSRWEVYLIHVQGSAALTLPDGSVLRVGYAGNNGHEYVSVSLELVEDGKISEDGLSLDEVKGYFDSHPQDLDQYLRRNPRFIFFGEETSSSWPLGSLGVPVTPLRSIATDKELFPPGGVTLVLTQALDASGRVRSFERFMLDQDRGGAILTPGRADLYFGIGPEAEKRAAGEYFEGRLYYLFLKPERVNAWLDKAGLDF